jgi:hypothetical protein
MVFFDRTVRACGSVVFARSGDPLLRLPCRGCVDGLRPGRCRLFDLDRAGLGFWFGSARLS